MHAAPILSISSKIFDSPCAGWLAKFFDEIDRNTILNLVCACNDQ
jgi:hypothetical protein